ncbi:MAG: L-threonylcarbamoyladenylate synthase, partial [Acidobacteriota bacterium]|nr:L-threonylcarbamoyladenylate synthase [Acidobacteriota bacterium]
MKTRVVRVDPERPEPEAIAEAAALIREGGLVAFPTETVYGLGANALDPRAVGRLFEAKGRPSTDPLIVHLAHIGQLGQVAADVSGVARALALAHWAGPLTLVLKKKAAVPDVVTAGLPTVAVRVPSHRVARALVETCGVPVAAPSANRFSRPSPTRAAHVLSELDGRIDLLLDGGPTPVGVESTIVDCTVSPPVLLRPGGVTREALLAQVPDLVVRPRFGGTTVAQPAPGQLARHYSPTARLTLFEGEVAAVRARLLADARALAAQGQRVGILAPEEDVLALAPDLAAQASGGRVRLQAYGRRSA